MTTVVDLGVDGPRTHALVIGVGRYPHCGPVATTEPDSVEAALARSLTDVASPPRSALAFAEWLLHAQVDDAVAPLGSIELLTSGNLAPAGAVTTDPPTFDAVQQAFARWFARCDTHEDNVAMFFFSGHGCAKKSQILLLEDVGESPLAFFANTIEIPTLVAGMARCRARTQCYFVDACRSTPTELCAVEDILSRPLIQPYLRREHRETVVISSTTTGREAYGIQAGPTIFTVALLAALDGAAARRIGERSWEVNTAQLVPTINTLLEWYGENRQRATSGGDFTGGSVLRRLRCAPTVPFRVDCSPSRALPMAELSLVDRAGGFHLRRAPEFEVWEDAVPASVCSLTALFPGNEYADSRRDTVLVHPPCAPLGIEVHDRTVTTGIGGTL